ncbi:MAG TPA: FAD-binding oxidoreductase [Steroidobacteraceae bacterium]
MLQPLARYPESYYSATAAIPAPAPPLAAPIKADVCVVGAGMAGCSAALHLAERGLKVVLLEEQRVGWGASGRNGGQVLPGIAKGQAALERLIGPGDARAIWDITLEGVRLLRQRIARYAIDCDWVDGHLQVAVKSRHVVELAAEQEALARLGYGGTRLVEHGELRGLLATKRYLAGLYDPGSGHLHPLRYTLGLGRAAQAAGAMLYEGTRASDYTVSAEAVRVRTAAAGASGEVHCRHLLLAGNAYLGSLAPALARKIMAVGTYIIATEPLGEARARELIGNNAAVSDLNWVLDYFRRSADHRLLFGGRVSYSGIERFEVAAATRARMLRVFPQLAGTRVDYHWGGYVDITLNRAPHFGRLAPNVWYLQGFCGHGVALTGIAGVLAAEAIAGSAGRFDLFARIAHRDFPGGALLRRPALVLAMLWYRLRDLL